MHRHKRYILDRLKFDDSKDLFEKKKKERKKSMLIKIKFFQMAQEIEAAGETDRMGNTR